MAEVLAVRATITKIFEGYSLTLVVKESGRSPAHRQESGKCF
jgi:hypothetical protein